MWSVIVLFSKGKCSVVCHCVFLRGKCSVVCHCGFKRISAVWSVIVF